MTLRVAMIFGGRSVEHEVSVLTAHQAMAALSTERYTIIPIYIAKSGQWYTGDALRSLENFRDLERLITQTDPITFNPNTPQPGFFIQRSGRRSLFGTTTTTEFVAIDIAFPLLHGSHGEDGTIQGLFELADIPYVGSNVTASAITINKILTKRLLRADGLPVVDDIALERSHWEHDQTGVIAEIEQRFGYPVYVKPARLGSSIGVAQATDRMTLSFALDVAATYDHLILIEPALESIIEINCAVLGDGPESRTSVCEQPIAQGTLSYEDKYLRSGKSKGMKGAQRIIPAEIAPDLTTAIQATAQRAFACVGAAGVVRIDFLVKPEENR